MKKYIYVALAILMSFCVLTGCSKSEQSSSEKHEAEETVSFFMEPIVNENNCSDGFICYRNTVTDVMYLWRWSMEKGGLTEMSDPETGLPLTYERYKELAKLKQEK